ncbi:MAG: hypothetical protein SFU98_16010 [Leptospiraceae bacterium]|nr:hypothetical protein [Leptospiraceae bacterium]
MKFILTAILITNLIACTKTGISDSEKRNRSILTFLYLQNRRDVNFNRVRYLNGRFYAVGTSGQIYSSTDGESWTKAPVGNLRSFSDIGFKDNRFLAVGNFIGYTSTDGNNWTDRSSSFQKSYTGVTNFVYQIVYGTNNYNYSTDGTNFNNESNFPSSIRGMYGHASSSTRLVLVGADEDFKATILTSGFFGSLLSFSSGGVTGVSSSLSLYDVAYNNLRFVAVGESGTILYSNDGLTWVKTTSPVSETLSGIATNAGKFVAVSGSSVITSNDGITWTKAQSLSNLASVTYGLDKYVAVGRNGTIFTSTDGNTWVSK